MLEANFCLLGKVALDSPPLIFFFFFLLVVAKHFLVRPASAGMLYGLRSVSRPVTGIEIVTPVWWGGGRRESSRDYCSGPATAGLKEALGAQNSWPGVDFALLSST